MNLPTFRTYVRRLRVPEFYPGVQGVGYSIRLRRQKISAVTRRLNHEGQVPFRPYPEHQRPERHAIIYLEPLDRRNQAAIGYDMFSEPVRREAMERAIILGDGECVTSNDLPRDSADEPMEDANAANNLRVAFESYERSHIENVLR